MAQRILLLQLELDTWRRARAWSYSAQLALEAGLRANNVRTLTITTPCFRRAREICGGARFDQVWLEVVHNDQDDSWFEWVAALAPVRLGMMGESLHYTSEELTNNPELGLRSNRARSRFKYLTHIAACDELDVQEINEQGATRAVWWPPSAPAAWVADCPPKAVADVCAFTGTKYHLRQRWLGLPAVNKVLKHQASPEAQTPLPMLFDFLSKNIQRHAARAWLPGIGFSNGLYLTLLRLLRRRAYGLWTRSLQKGVAVVNLPHPVKTYASRVIEGMAAGRPVISWEIPNRPKNRALFEDGQDILLFSQDRPELLVEHVQRLVSNRTLASQLARNATRKVRLFHTTEHRVEQFLRWIESADEPVYA
jgi:hypothetical protein